MCTLESFEPPGVEERELIICRMRAGCEPVLVKINTTTGEEKLKENEVCQQKMPQIMKNTEVSVYYFFSTIENSISRSLHC